MGLHPKAAAEVLVVVLNIVSAGGDPRMHKACSASKALSGNVYYD
jgi:hypothetical protein